MLRNSTAMAGWRAGTPYYDMPYTEDQAAELETFDEDRITY